MTTPTMEPSNLNAFLPFFQDSERKDVQMVAFHELLALTGSKEGCSMIERHGVMNELIKQSASENGAASKAASLSLVNISASETGASRLLNAYIDNKEYLSQLLNAVMDSESGKADACCMILSNLTRTNPQVVTVVNFMLETGYSIENLVNVFTKKKFNSRGCNLNYLGPFFSNLSQTREIRLRLVQHDDCALKKLLPIIHHESLIRRGGVAGTIRNCCFDSDLHEQLLGPEIDVLPRLLLPLAGPEEFDDEDNEKLPIELQYLDTSKERESDLDIRKMLLEALLQLCATKFGREFLRSRNAYLILREYHKWEKNRSALLACENVVDILIRTEVEINEGNLKEVIVPADLSEKFEKMDKDYLRDQ